MSYAKGTMWEHADVLSDVVSLGDGYVKSANFFSQDYKAESFDEVTFENCCFTCMEFDACSFSNTEFKECTFNALIFEECDMSAASFNGCHFNSAVRFNGCELPLASFSGTELDEAIFEECNLTDVTALKRTPARAATITKSIVLPIVALALVGSAVRKFASSSPFAAAERARHLVQTTISNITTNKTKAVLVCSSGATFFKEKKDAEDQKKGSSKEKTAATNL